MPECEVHCACVTMQSLITPPQATREILQALQPVPGRDVFTGRAFFSIARAMPAISSGFSP